jgi:outer membrane receptor protein involved in Fe transport
MTNFRTASSLRAIAVAALTAALPQTVWAQSGEQAAESYEEILVTAQKRTENVLDVPSSISVIGGDQVEGIRATQVADFAAYVPGLDIGNAGAPGQTRLTLRGVGLGSSTATVGTYIDDTPFGSSAGWQRSSTHALDLFPYDIQRVEVLRGPQGTLYGANTMGGLLKYVLRSPDLDEVEGRAGGEIRSIRHADDLGWGVRGAINVPLITNQVAVRASFFNQHTPGYIDNPVRGESDTNEVDQWGGRFALLWKAGDNISVKLSALVQDIESDDSAVVALDPTTREPLLGDLTANRFLNQPFNQRLQYYTGTVDWDLGGLSLVSASSYSRSKLYELADETSSLGALIPVFSGGAITESRTFFTINLELEKFTQEFRLSSQSDGPFQWLAGLFYTHENADNRQLVLSRAPDGSLLPGTFPTSNGEGLASLNTLVVADVPTKYEEKAVFGNATLELTDRFEIGVGLRYAKNEQDFTGTTAGYLLLDQVQPNASDEDVFNYAVSAQYDLTDDVMTYARVASGYRPGGPNSPLPDIPLTVSSDSLTSYELGLKGQILDRRGVFDVALYRIDWADIQLSLLNTRTGASYLGNAGKARSQGVEFSTNFAPTEALRLGFNAAYTDAELREDLPPSPDLRGQKGNRLPGSAKWTLAATGNYEFPIGAGWRGDVGGAFRYVGDRLSTVSGDPRVLQIGSYETLDVNIGASNDDWNVSLFVKNATDTRGYLSQAPVTSALGPRVRVNGTVIQPRVIGISVDRRF